MTNNIMKSGRLELIIGPMFASKSTEVIRRINRYRAKNLRVLVINHSINNRYGSQHITTHDSTELKCCLILDKLKTIWEEHMEEYEEADIIAIEELQFFEDSFEFVTTAMDRDHKQVIAAGLVSDYKRERFGCVLDLIPHAEEILHLKAYCALCEDIVDGCFTKRIINKDVNTNIRNMDEKDIGEDKLEQIIVGEKDTYVTVCRYHYLN